MPHRPFALAALLAGCSGAIPPGTSALVDHDGDGYAASDGDCDDRDPDVHPQALDLPGDGIDADCDGEDAEALPARALGPGDLAITEVMADPVGVSPDLGEWFELYNTLDVDVDLEGVRFADDLTDDFLVARPLRIEANSALVLGAVDDEDLNGGAPVDFRYPAGFGLSNREDQIRLWVDGALLASAAWDATWPRRAGYTLSRDPGADPLAEGPDGWCLAQTDAVYGIGGRGTPGESNPDCPPPFTGLHLSDLEPGDLVITEVMQDPLAVGDDFGEWFEVYVATDAPVELLGLIVEDDEGNAFEIDASLRAEPDSYLVFGSFLDPEVSGGAPVDAEWRWSFGLANSGDTIRLLAGTQLIDEIAYDNGATFPDPEGASMSLDPSALDDDDNDDGARWCTGSTPYGAGDLGTPGAPNPPCEPPP